MNGLETLVQQARLLPKDKRQTIITSFGETQLHRHLKALFDSMEPNYRVAITHGSHEYGKDLVIVKQDNLGTDVTAVVVKVGDIKGTTAGDVDKVSQQVREVLKAATLSKLQEIESQVKQAIEHPAELSTIFRELPVTKVIVILAGHFSRQARKRLVGEVRLNLEDIHDIDWLVDKFTEHYPQVFFEQEAIDFLQKQIADLEGTHWLGKRRISLSDYYIDPVVAKTATSGKVDAQHMKGIGKRERVPFSKLKKAVIEKQRVLLLGDPSSGKSGAMVKLAIEMLREAAAEVFQGERTTPMELPALTSARQILGAENVDELLTALGLTPEVRDRARIKILLVDALDEVPSSIRKEALDKASRFADELKCSLLIASRKIDLVKTPPMGFTEYELLPFQVSQALRLFEKLLGGRKDILTALKVGLERIQFKIPMFPLSLIFLLDLVEERKEIPASVTELYDRFADMALGRWDRDRGIEVLFEYLIKKRFLASLAYRAMLSQTRIEIRRPDFELFLEEYAKEYDWDESYRLSFMRELERTGVLEISETVFFRHRSFLDYFGGFYIYDQHDKIETPTDLVARIYFDENWGETAFFSVGLRREIAEALLERIFAREPEDFRSHLGKFMVGRLLQAGWHSKARIRKAGIERGLSYASQVREDILQISDGGGKKILPPILGNLIAVGIGEGGFESGFLFNDLKAILNGYLSQKSTKTLLASLVVLFSLRNLLGKVELREAIDDYMNVLAEVGTIEEQASALPILMLIQKDDKPALKKVKLRAMKLLKRYPDVVKKLTQSS